MSSLRKKAFGGLAVLLLVMASLVFAVAGTLRYWQAWTFLAVYFAASLAITLDLIRNDPALLARRMSGGPFAEKEPAQKLIMSATSLGFIGLLVLPAVDHRLGWSDLPGWAAIAGDVIMLLGWLGISSSSGKTALPRRSSNPPPTSASYPAGPTRGCGTRCMRRRS
jgi:hypothetical protein